MKQVVLSGYYGFGNAGDEAVLEAMISALKAVLGVETRLTVLSSRPEWTADRYRVTAISRVHLPGIIKTLKQSDMLISGGGSLLQDVTGITTIPYYLGVIRLAQWLKVPTVIYAQGIGPVRRPFFYPFIRSAFNASAYISVRDQASAALLQAMGVKQPIETVADPVFALKPQHGEHPRIEAAANRLDPGNQTGAGDRRPIVVSLRPWRGVEERVIPIVADLLDRWLEDGETVSLLPMQSAMDRPVLEKLAQRMRHQDKLGWLDGDPLPSVQMGIIGGARLVLGMRLHALIFAAAQGIPFIPLSYDPKVDQLVRRLDYPIDDVLQVETLTAEGLARQAAYIEALRSECQAVLRKTGEILCRDAYRPAQAVATLLQRG